MSTSKAKLKIRQGDIVQIIAGNDKGKNGKVLEVNLEKSRLVVEGLNLVTKHVKPSAEKPQGGIEKREASIHISNVAYFEKDTAVRVGRKLNEDGKIVRYSKKTGEIINNG